MTDPREIRADQAIRAIRTIANILELPLDWNLKGHFNRAHIADILMKITQLNQEAKDKLI
jgi:hypothetical protein